VIVRCPSCNKIGSAANGGYCKNHVTAVPTVAAPDPAVIAAMSAETVHIDALDDDEPSFDCTGCGETDVPTNHVCPVVQEAAPVKTAAQMTSSDINALSGIFDVTIDGLKRNREEARAQCQKSGATIVRFKSDQFVTSKGEGRWLSVPADIYATIDDDKYVGRAVRIQLETGSKVVRLGRAPANKTVPVDTNPQPTISAAASRRASTRRAKQDAKRAPVRQTVEQTNVPTDICPKCDRRFGMVGKGQRGLCAVCAPKTARKAS
jgi:hypothetical protein